MTSLILSQSVFCGHEKAAIQLSSGRERSPIMRVLILLVSVAVFVGVIVLAQRFVGNKSSSENDSRKDPKVPPKAS